MLITGGRALDGLGGYTTLPNPTKLRIPVNLKYGRQTTGAKIRGQEGNSPDRRLRSQNYG